MSIAGVVSAAPTAPARWRSRFVNRGESPADCMPPVSESRRATSLRKSVEATFSPAEAAAAANCAAARRPAAICGSSAVGDPHPRWNDPTTVPTGWSTSGSREQRRLGPGEVGVASPLGGGEDECGLVQAEADRQIARLTTRLNMRCVIHSRVGSARQTLERPLLAPTRGPGWPRPYGTPGLSPVAGVIGRGKFLRPCDGSAETPDRSGEFTRDGERRTWAL
jgi:hypothetical protein